MWRNKFIGNILVVMGLLILYYLIFARSFFTEAYFFPGDSFRQWSLKFMTLYSLKHFNEFPWWDPTIYNGYPVYYHFISGYANYLGPYYLPPLILFKFLNTIFDININSYIVFHRTIYVVSLNMIAIFLISREVISNRIAAVLPVLIFTFSYFQILNFHDFFAVESMIAPLFFIYSLIRFNNNRSTQNLILLFLFAGMLFSSLSGGIMMSAFYWTSIFTILLVLFNLSIMKDFYNLIKTGIKNRGNRIIFILCLCLLVSGIIASLLPIHYNLDHVIRYRGGEVDLSTTAGFANKSIPIETSQLNTVFLNWLPFPEINKYIKFLWNGHEYRYIGLITLPLIAISFLLNGRNKYVYIFFLTYFICNVFFIYTEKNLFYIMLTDYSAILKSMRNMSTIFPRGGPSLFLIFLAGLGLDGLINNKERNKISITKKSLTALILFGIGLVFIYFLGAGVYAFKRGVSTSSGALHSVVYIGVYLIIFSYFCFLLLLEKDHKVKKWIIYALLIFTFMDLTVSASHNIDVFDGDLSKGISPETLMGVDKFYGRIPKEKLVEYNISPIPKDSKFRIAESEKDHFFPLNYVGGYHHTHAEGINLGIREWLFLATNEKGRDFLINWNSEKTVMKKYPEFKFFSNGYYLPFENIKDIGYEQSINKREPLFYLHDKELVSSIKDIPREIKGKYEIMDYTFNKVTLKTSIEENVFLYFLDNYSPFWSAYIDEKSVPIYRANFTFKAIKLPAGDHTISFIYNPFPIKISYLIFYLFLLAFLFMQLTYKLKSLLSVKGRNSFQSPK